MKIYIKLSIGLSIWFCCTVLSIEATENLNLTNHAFPDRELRSDVAYPPELQGVLGTPGVDFPVFPYIPKTSFTCKDVLPGYYADLETRCQVFHICDEGRKISFLCPNGTIFQQSDLICEWWFKVDCAKSPNYYEESAEHLHEERIRFKQSRKVLNPDAPSSEVHESRTQDRNLSGEKHSYYQGNKQSRYFQHVQADFGNSLNSKESQVASESASFVGNRRNQQQRYRSQQNIVPTAYTLKEDRPTTQHPNHNYGSTVESTQHSYYSPTVPQITRPTTTPIPASRKSSSNGFFITHSPETDAFAAPKPSNYARNEYVSFSGGHGESYSSTATEVPLSLVSAPQPFQTTTKKPRDYLAEHPNHRSTYKDDFEIVQKPVIDLSLQAPYKQTTAQVHGTELRTSQATPFDTNFNRISNRNFEESFNTQGDKLTTSQYTYLPNSRTTITQTPPPTTPTPYVSNTTPFMSQNVVSMIKTLEQLDPPDAIKELEKLTESRPGLDIPPSAGPNTLHSLAIYFANALDDIVANNDTVEEEKQSTTTTTEENNEDIPQLFTKSTQEKYNSLFTKSNATKTKVSDIDNDLDVQQSRGPVSSTPRVRQLAQVFTHALAAYLDDPATFKRVLQEIRPTEPPPTNSEFETTTFVPTTLPTTSTTEYSYTEEGEVLDFSDADKPSTILPILNIPRKQYPQVPKVKYGIGDSKVQLSLNDIGRSTPKSVHKDVENFIPLSSSNYNTPTPNPLALDLNKEINPTSPPNIDEIISNLDSSPENFDNESYFPLNNERDEEYEKKKVTAKPYGHGLQPANATPIHDGHQIPPTPLKWPEVLVEPVNVLLPPFISYSQRTQEQQANNDSYAHNEEYLQSAHSQSFVGRGNRVQETNYQTRKETAEPITRSTLEPIIVEDTTEPIFETTEEPTTTRNIETFLRDSSKSNTLAVDSLLDENLRAKLGLENHWTLSSAVTKLWRDTLYVNPLTINVDLQNRFGKTPSGQLAPFREATTTTLPPFTTRPPTTNYQYYTTTSPPRTTTQYFRTTTYAPRTTTLSPRATTFPPRYQTFSPPRVTTFPPRITTFPPRITTTTEIPTTETPTTTEFATQAPQVNFAPNILTKNTQDKYRYLVLNHTDTFKSEANEANELFGSLNSTEQSMLMEKMKEAESNTTVRRLILLLISTCDSNYSTNKTVQDARAAILSALLDNDNTVSLDRNNNQILDLSGAHTSNGASSRYSRDYSKNTGNFFNQVPHTNNGRHYPPVQTTTTTSTTTHSPPQSSFVRTSIIDPSRPATHQDADHDTRALELLRSLYSLAAKWGKK